MIIMDFSKLKGRPPFPFTTIGVAVAFSPRLVGVLAEAKRLAATCGAKLLLIHIGERTPAHAAQLTAAREHLGLNDPEVREIWQQGDTVATLLALCKQNSVDLLVLGARRRENVLRHYLGSVARGISRAAKCSLLLLTDPKAAGTPFNTLVVSGVENPKTIHTMNTAVYFAQQVGSSDITVVTELDQPGLAMAMADDSTAGQATSIKKQFASDAANQAHAMVGLCRPSQIHITETIIPGRPGYAIRHYAASNHADLLVINSPDAKYGLIDRIFTHDMEYILEDLPCSMLIVHSRVS
jgi:nucleotide-binding universal stress UspA family protein